MDSATAEPRQLPATGTTAPQAAPGTSDAPSHSLRYRLFLLAASGLVPLALVLLTFTGYLARERQADTQHAALELSRALATAVDAELTSTISLLETLATSTDLQAIEPWQLEGRFSALARRVAQQQYWRTLVVADAQGRVLMRADDSGNRSAQPVEAISLAQVLATGAPVVGRVTKDRPDAFAVRIPVAVDGRLRYVLSAVVPTSRILAVVARQQLAPSWVVSVHDGDGGRVARSRPASSPRYSPSLEALVKSSPREGQGMTRTLEGVDSHTGFTWLRQAQWVVAVGIPAAEANADLYRLLSALVGGIAASLGLLGWLALRTARSISEPIAGLKRAASALGGGQHVALRASGVQELDEVGIALRQAASDRDEANLRRDRVEAEREQLLVRLEEALRNAEQANRNKDEFLALLGHELRNPLAPITNAVHLMHLKGDASTVRERAIIQRQLQYVTRLVDDLLDASRITSRRFVINLRPLRPVALLEQTVEAVKATLGQRRLEVHVDPQARPLWVSADDARLVQVFNNLLGNAVKFTGPAGAIEVRAIARGGDVEFVFRDDGAGMAAADLERAFELFYQGPNGERGVNGGLGLGLAIVKSLVDMHAGEVRVHSDGPGTGTTVSVRLPGCAPPQQDAGAPLPELALPAARLLVVDDNADAADTLAALLETADFKVQAVYTPQSALDVVDAFSPALAILDIGLPGMDGYELARRLRSRVPPFTGPLVALTGYGQRQDVQRAMDAGFDAHLTKPVTAETLLQLLARLLAAARPD